MLSARRFLVVDDNADSRFLLVKTLVRKFPPATVHETGEADEALAIALRHRCDAVVVHRAAEVDGLTLIRLLREAVPQVPIVMVSGVDRREQAREAGAVTFLSYDEWLRIGTVVAGVLAESSAREPAGEKQSSDLSGM
jgi:CheY-like chemotaxis protein